VEQSGVSELLERVQIGLGGRAECELAVIDFKVIVINLYEIEGGNK